ncbi:MAG: hypothetical protein HKN68_06095 [Saprospiraceae bacterium]|nr:hypothetical protein [Saprospiraceae bacterium]
MEPNEIIEQIKEYIAKGKTEKALEALVEYTKENNLPTHDEAILLSGQFSQWKRENMLGVQQSHSELRRIEMTMMDILQGNQDVYKESSVAKKKSESPKPIVTSPTTSNSSDSNMGKIIAGVIAVAAIALAIWYFSSKGGDGATDQEDVTKTETTTPPSTPGTSTTTTTPPSQPNTSGVPAPSPLPIKPGQELQVDVPYKTANGDYYLMFQADGNVVVKTTEEESFRWGSMQAGAGMERIPSRVVMQNDGNFVLYAPDESFIWGTMSTVPGSTLAITYEGNLQVVAPNGSVVWEGSRE